MRMRTIWAALSATAALLLLALPSLSRDSSSLGQSTAGETIYRKVCQACHMSGGEGARSSDVRVPALANNPALGTANFPVMVILNGRGAMPWFNGVLTPPQIAAVATYIRTHFGNKFLTPITAEDVKRLAGPAPTIEEYH